MKEAHVDQSRYAALSRFAEPFEDGESWPRPVCPTCGDGYVSFGEPETSEDGQSRSLQSERAWEPFWVHGTFRATGQCEKPSCRQEVTVTGTYTVGDASGRGREWEPDNDEYYDQYSVFYRVEYFSPPLTLLLLPKDSPDQVREALARAAKVIYLDPGLAATAVRAAVERYLTSAGIAPTSETGGFVPLDKRLENWRITTGHGREADLLRAVKWIGNSGTHEPDELTASDVLDGVRFIDEVFHSLYVAPDVDAKAQAVNAHRGPSTTPIVIA